jgi:hypothetical protein
LFGQDQVPEVDRVECAAKEPQTHGPENPAQTLQSTLKRLT